MKAAGIMRVFSWILVIALVTPLALPAAASSTSVKSGGKQALIDLFPVAEAAPDHGRMPEQIGRGAASDPITATQALTGAVPAPLTAPVTATVVLTSTANAPDTFLSVLPPLLTMRADPFQVLPGGVIAYSVAITNMAEAPLTSVVLSDTLPAGVVYVAQSGVGFSYSPRDQRLTWAIERIEPGEGLHGGFQLRATGLGMGQLITNTVSAVSAATPVVTASAVVEVAPPRQNRVIATPAEGAWLRSEDGRVDLRVPPQAVTTDVAVQYQPQPATGGLLAVFGVDIGPERRSSANAVQLQQPARLLVNPEARAGETGALQLLLWDETSGDWLWQDTSIDPLSGYLATMIFSGGTFAVASGGPEYGVQILPSLKAFTSDLWSGAARVDYGLDVPAGAAGFGIDLRLAYNSQGSNVLNQVAGSSYQSQASWVGLGWDLAGIGSITRAMNQVDGRLPYFLSFGGGSFEIVERNGVLTTDPQGFLKIQHAGGLSWNPASWTVRTPDGMTYTFGNPNGGVGDGTAYEPFWIDVGNGCQDYGLRAYQWGLTRVVDPSGNRWDIEWDHETKQLANGCFSPYNEYTRASYPGHIAFTPAGSGASTVRVRFEREGRNDRAICKYNDPYIINLYGDGRLKRVHVEMNAGSGWQLVRRYDLGYTYDGTTLACGGDPGSGNHSLLSSITQYDGNGTGALPPYTFTYDGAGNGVRLKTANNGYGGQVQFDYDLRWVANNAGCTSYHWHMVTRKTVSNGTASGMGVASITEYNPQNAYAYVLPLGCANGAEIPRQTYEFLGHTRVDETVKNAAAVAVTEREHRFAYQYSNGPDPRKGKPTLVITRQPGAGELARTATGWGVESVNGVSWPVMRAVTQTQTSGSLSATSVTRYDYATANQSGSQYGNVTHIREYASASATTPYRTTERWYYPRNDATGYVVNRVGQEKLWQGDAGGSCRGQTRWIYDGRSGHAQFNLAPTQGRLREVWQAGAGGTSCDGNWWNSAAYSYDNYGNTTSVAGPAGMATHTVYDTSFHIYPTTVTVQPGAWGGTTQTTSYRYYGVNAEAGGGGLVGQVQTITDANGAVTRLSYDAFGRVIEIRKPGAEWSNPATEKYQYTDSPAPLRIMHSLRDDVNGDTSSSASYLDSYTFYDGLGQVVQTQTEIDNEAHSIIASTSYNALGLAAQANVPGWFRLSEN